MKKVTRLLLLYSKLIQGEKINKINFCMECGCLPRSFDRDIEDLRIYLSEAFYHEELIYDRKENVYYLNGQCRRNLENIEYLFIERILLDTGCLIREEMDGLLAHLITNTENMKRRLISHKDIIKEYKEPTHHKAILKMHGDLVTIINNKSVIKIQYSQVDRAIIEHIIIPCLIKYDSGRLYLIAFNERMQEHSLKYYELDRINSFLIIREQSMDEKEFIERYLNNYSSINLPMERADSIGIIILCKRSFYPFLYDKFKNIQIIDNEIENLKIKLWAFEHEFIKWIISQPTDLITVLEPMDLKIKIANEANKILTIYKEFLNNGEKN